MLRKLRWARVDCWKILSDGGTVLRQLPHESKPANSFSQRRHFAGLIGTAEAVLLQNIDQTFRLREFCMRLNSFRGLTGLLADVQRAPGMVSCALSGIPMASTGDTRVKIQTLVAGLILIGAAISEGVFSQTPSLVNSISFDRKIEVMIRSQYSIPGTCDVKIGPRTPSSIPGYEQLHVTLTQGTRNTAVDFLISTDGRKLAHLDQFDLNTNPALSIDVAGRPIRGNPAAPVTVINFDDLECPVCSYLNGEVIPAALRRYGEGVRFIYKDNPLVAMHPWALHAAVDATCLADQNSTAYWSYVDDVHSHGQEIGGGATNLEKSFAVLDRMAGEVAQKSTLDENTLQACVGKQDEAPVRQSMSEAKRLGLDFTPALFVNGEEVRGLTTLDDLWVVIDRALRESGVNPPQTKAPQGSK